MSPARPAHALCLRWNISVSYTHLVATLYALKFLKEQGYELRYPIRALAGTNEETHMQDVDYYLKNYPCLLYTSRCV